MRVCRVSSMDSRNTELNRRLGSSSLPHPSTLVLVWMLTNTRMESGRELGGICASMLSGRVSAEKVKWKEVFRE